MRPITSPAPTSKKSAENKEDKKSKSKTHLNIAKKVKGVRERVADKILSPRNNQPTPEEIKNLFLIRESFVKDKEVPGNELTETTKSKKEPASDTKTNIQQLADNLCNSTITSLYTDQAGEICDSINEHLRHVVSGQGILADDDLVAARAACKTEVLKSTNRKAIIGAIESLVSSIEIWEAATGQCNEKKSNGTQLKTALNDCGLKINTFMSRHYQGNLVTCAAKENKIDDDILQTDFGDIPVGIYKQNLAPGLNPIISGSNSIWNKFLDDSISNIDMRITGARKKIKYNTDLLAFDTVMNGATTKRDQRISELKLEISSCFNSNDQKNIAVKLEEIIKDFARDLEKGIDQQ